MTPLSNSPSTARKTGKDVLREVDEDALALARQLLRATPPGALGTLDPDDGSPLASLTSL